MNEFNGFPQDGFNFLAELADNNDKAWFETNKHRYETSLMEPAKAFIATIGKELEAIAPNIRYDTKTNGSGSLMRIYRDTRFSKDKTPYKTNISGLWWEGSGKKNGSPAFGFQMTIDGMGLMAGLFGFDKDQLTRFREVVGSDQGAILQDMVDSLQNDPAYEIVGEQYKRIPSGFEDDHPRAELLKYKGLYAHPLAAIPPKALMSGDAVPICMDHFVKMAPIQRWLADALL